MVGLLAAIACGGDKSVSPSVPATIAANSSTSLTGVAGSPVSPAPSVVVKDENGDPAADVTVNFAVTGGGGTVSAASVQTDGSGIATVAWTLGTTAGSNALSASTGTLAAVTFTATGTAGTAASLTKSAGDNQTGLAGSPVAVPPQVTVKDANGNPKSGVVVTFSVASGGGSVTGASATSNAQGVATVGSWTLGPQAGVNTLSASATGVAAVTFTATAGAASGCAVRATHLLGTTTQGTLATTDCQADGFFIDLFTTSLGSTTAYLFRQTAAFDTYLFLAAADGSVIAENDDEVPNSTNTNSGIKAFLPAGSYLLGASSFLSGTTGDYAISSSTTSATVSGCEQVFVLKNFSTTQSVEAADCSRTTAPAAPIYGDAYVIFLRAGQSITITMASTQVDAFIEVLNNLQARLAFNDNRDGTTKDAELTFTAPETHYYTIIAATAVTSQTGTYTLTSN
jgi:hypothetical protein